jgi:hypothetical protein
MRRGAWRKRAHSPPATRLPAGPTRDRLEAKPTDQHAGPKKNRALKFGDGFVTML